MVDMMLASSTYCSPNRINWSFATQGYRSFSRVQVRRHRDYCNQGLSELIFGFREGLLTLEELEEGLQEASSYTEEQKAGMRSLARELAEPAYMEGGGR